MNEDAAWKAASHMGEFVGEVLMSLYPRMLEKTGAKVESPIEEMMLVGFMGLQLIDPDFTIAGFRENCRTANSSYRAILYCQRPFDKYRADFAVHVECTVGDATKTHWIIVECDGHQYHERTTWQAARDKARDRFFNTQGFTVLRFTGSEIHASVSECVGEVYKAVTSALERMRAA